MLCPPGRALALGALLIAVITTISACSGGGGGDGDLSLKATIENVDTTTFAAQGVVRIEYSVTGPRGETYAILPKYRLLPNGEFVPAKAAPTALGVPQSKVSGTLGVPEGPILIPGEDRGDFFWWAGADLGFVMGQVQFEITPFTTDPTNPDGTAGASNAFTYTGGQPSRVSTPVGGDPQSGAGSGPGDPGGTGRAGQTATNVRGTPGVGVNGSKNVLIAGGFNDALAPNAFNTADRFNFNMTSFSHSRVFSEQFPGMEGRALHASSFFLDPLTGLIRVVITGGVDRLDATGNTLASRVTGGNATSSGAVYSFTPVEDVAGTANNMVSSRYGHTATWIPSNEVVIIGGATGTAPPVAVSEIEHFDPSTSPPNGTFINPLAPGLYPMLAFPRVEHTSTLLADGRILVAGGYNPAAPGNALECEIYNPRNGTSSVVSGSALSRFGHTATRLTNGWVLIVGGRDPVSNNLIADARIFRPETGLLDPQAVALDRARALHTATLLGDRQVLIAGGLTSAAGGIGTLDFTTSAQVFRPPVGFTVTPTAFTPVNPLQEPRAEHSATAVDCGSVFIIGGRNAVGSTSGLNFLESVEFYAFSNAVPTIMTPMTATSSQGGNTLAINFTVDDADDDGGYVVIRFRTTPGTGRWQHATIVAQTPSSAPGNFANHEVFPGPYSFIWNFGADGVPNGTDVEIQIIPFGAAIGSSVQFNARTP